MSINLRLSLFTAVSALLLTGTAAAQDNPAGHQHGRAELQLSIEETRIDAFLLSPAANLVGFEHAPETDEQKQALADLQRWAETRPMVNTPEGHCRVESAEVYASWPKKAGDRGHDHHDHESHGGHADIEISQSLDCPGLGKELETPLTARFPAMEHLDVQWVGLYGQGSRQLGPGRNQLILDE
ncbi:Protein of unknown function [Marinobacter persicus]|uniref:DUF2796 domain-containing protein n=1 Tax=Marinobacter persicus TaxID=930118 RepID=A0A1I3R2X2_9GAMM|nr:DUF2796 domain-containing protein [Marinobacter persicus]GHD43339.1 hypothetical protein GCM10008110_07130 [Marinobacter persicus]SFJ39727.1 Protein of unknown function [Marinobacter persicus]